MVNWTREMGGYVLGGCYLNKAVYLGKIRGTEIE